MAKAVNPIKQKKRSQTYYQIGLLFPDGKKIVKKQCSLNEVFETYFLKLENYLDKNYTPEQLFELYENTYKNKGVKVQINFIDSWEHKWTGKCAWPRKEKFLNYLENEINRNSSI